MNCKKCGNILENGALFCNFCGEQVGGNAASNGGISPNNMPAEQNVMNVPNNNGVVGQVPDNTLESPVQPNVQPVPEVSDSTLTAGSSVPQGQNQENLGGSVQTVQQVTSFEQPPVGTPSSQQVTNFEQPQMPVNAPQPMEQNNLVQNAGMANQNVQNNGVINNAPAQVGVGVVQNQAPVNAQTNNKKSRKSFMIIVAILLIVILVLAALIATGGIKFKFTVSSPQTNPTTNQNIKTDENESTTRDTTTTRPMTTVAPVSNGNYMNYKGLSVFVPETFIVQEDESLVYQSREKNQMFAVDFDATDFLEAIDLFPEYIEQLNDQGLTVVSADAQEYKDMKYVVARGIYENGVTMSAGFASLNDGSTIMFIFRTDYALESAYLETLYQISTNTTTTANFAPTTKDPGAMLAKYDGLKDKLTLQ